MKSKFTLPLLSIIFLCGLAIMVMASNQTSSPSVVYAACRPPVVPCTPTKAPKLTKTKSPVTDTPSPTPTETYTPSPTFTPTDTPTITPSATPTNTPTITPSPTSTPFPREVKLNEILPNAKFKDWNKDGTPGPNDQWIELYNSSNAPADVSGWSIDTGEKTPSFLIPNQTIIPPGGFALFFRSQTQLNLDTASQVRLLFPSGSISDEVGFPALDFDRVYARLRDGQNPWRAGCVPTPLSKNCQSAESFSSQFNLPFFQRSIYGPFQAFQDPEVVVTNVLLAIILALAIGFFSNLLNDAIESHEENYARLFGFVLAPINNLRSRLRGVDESVTKSRRNPWLEFAIKITVILIIYGTIMAYLDPSFQFINQDGFLLILALGFSSGLVSMIDDLAIFLYLRIKGGSGRVTVHSSNFLMVLVTTIFSRFAQLTPGLLLGSPAGLEDLPDEYNGPHLDILAVLVTAGAGLAAWGLSTLTSDPWLTTVLLLIFGAGVQTAFFEMLPLSYLRGKSIFKTSPLLWLALFVGAAVLFLQTMLNPNGPFLSAFLSANMLMLSVFTILYCLICTAIWFFLTRAEQSK